MRLGMMRFCVSRRNEADQRGHGFAPAFLDGAVEVRGLHQNNVGTGEFCRHVCA